MLTGKRCDWGAPLASVAPAGGSNQGDGLRPVPIPSDFVPASVAPAGAELVEGRRLAPSPLAIFPATVGVVAKTALGQFKLVSL
jgi:hypothetical protein